MTTMTMKMWMKRQKVETRGSCGASLDQSVDVTLRGWRWWAAVVVVLTSM